MLQDGELPVSILLSDFNEIFTLSVFLRVPFIFTVNGCLELRRDSLDGVFNIGEIPHFKLWRLHVAKRLSRGKPAALGAFLCVKLSLGLPATTYNFLKWGNLPFGK